MKSGFKFNGAYVVALLCLVISVPVARHASAQFPNSLTVGTTPVPGGPVAVGQEMAHRSDDGRVTIVQAPPASGGVIQLSAFGWMEPYVDSIAQGLLGLGLAWLARSKYTQWMDQSARDALEAFTRNTASSLIADGFVHMEGKTISVHGAALASEANTAAERIPGALKRFGLTPGAVKQKIVDAIPQTPAGAAMVAASHSPQLAGWPPTAPSAS